VLDDLGGLFDDRGPEVGWFEILGDLDRAGNRRARAGCQVTAETPTVGQLGCVESRRADSDPPLARFRGELLGEIRLPLDIREGGLRTLGLKWLVGGVLDGDLDVDRVADLDRARADFGGDDLGRSGLDRAAERAQISWQYRRLIALADRTGDVAEIAVRLGQCQTFGRLRGDRQGQDSSASRNWQA